MENQPKFVRIALGVGQHGFDCAAEVCPNGIDDVHHKYTGQSTGQYTGQPLVLGWNAHKNHNSKILFRQILVHLKDDRAA